MLKRVTPMYIILTQLRRITSDKPKIVSITKIGMYASILYMSTMGKISISLVRHVIKLCLGKIHILQCN